MSAVRVRCPMGDWAQVAPDRETAITLQVRHGMDAHSVGPGNPPPDAVARCDEKLAAAQCPYQPPDGRYVP